MKTTALFLVAACLVSLPFGSFASIKPELKADRVETIEKNLLQNLECDCVEIRATTLQTIVDLMKAYPTMDFDVYTIPVMSLLKSDEIPEVRILAAIALYYSGSELGRFAVQRRGLYDPSERVARMCNRLTSAWGLAPTHELTAFSRR